MRAERRHETWDSTTGIVPIKAKPYLEAGEIVDRFRIGRILGIGGHGVVYAAEHVELGYPVALKVMERWASADPRRRARFQREVMIGARLRHRNIVAILEAGRLADDTPYLVMEHVEGVDLGVMLGRGALSPDAVADLGVQLLAALTALAAHGIVHRDIKPQNIMLQRSIDDAVEVKLLDFGIVKTDRQDRVGTLTEDGFVLGTPQYMSPEQVRGEAIDARSDLYAVATVLYEALTGSPPFDGESSEAVLTKVLVDDASSIREQRPDCPQALADVIARGMDKDRDRRWASPTEMAAALAEAARGLGLARGGDAWTYATVSPRTPARQGRPALRLVPELGSRRATTRELPTLAERPSALGRRRSTPRHRPPWWPAVALAVAYLCLFAVARAVI